ncbi:MAG: response regulator [Anaerolineae bacterium]|nr:response regulator [Anaerolineae bacterium]
MAEKILIIDDDLETLRLVGMMLQKQGFVILAANTGTQGIKTAETEKPDLVVLDIMIPDIDGYEIARRLRANEDTRTTPILMFTAKTQVEDKVAGYEAGADDYLTKPVHPAELTARVRSLLSRRTATPAPTTGCGKVLGFIAAKGGMGTSTLTLNLAIKMQQKSHQPLIAAELRPGYGSWAIEMGMESPNGLTRLLDMKPEEITKGQVETELLQTTFGPKLLMASTNLRDVHLANAGAQLEALVGVLSHMANFVLLDLGATYLQNYDRILNLCNEVMVLADPYPGIIQPTRLLMSELGRLGFGKAKLMNLVILNRTRGDLQLSITQMQESFGTPLALTIPPAPETAYQAALGSVPITQIQTDSLMAQQYNRLAEQVLERLSK